MDLVIGIECLESPEFRAGLAHTLGRDVHFVVAFYSLDAVYLPLIGIGVNGALFAISFHGVDEVGAWARFFDAGSQLLIVRVVGGAALEVGLVVRVFA